LADARQLSADAAAGYTESKSDKKMLKHGPPITWTLSFTPPQLASFLEHRLLVGAGGLRIDPAR
jgi:hypothetical protein